MNLYTGTSGFSYKEWKGSFYPKDLKNDQMLSYYAAHLNAVEINNTFYRMPKRTVLANWREQTSSEFRFVIKASRRITHMSRLKECDEAVDYLCSNVETLAEYLGCLLFQLPGNFQKDVDRLQSLLGLLPYGMPAAVEFRHESWLCDQVYDCLRKFNAALCFVDQGKSKSVPKLVSTANWGYLRLRGESYTKPRLRKWAHAIANTEWEQAFVFFKHEDAGAGPQLALDFARVCEQRT